MKKKFSYIFLFIFSFISFYITYKTANIIKQADIIMKQIKENMKYYNSSSVDGIILNDTIIPGINGVKVNIDRSYNKMKQVGFFSDKLFVYNIVENNNLLSDNLDKYIINGSKLKKGVSILLFIDEETDISILDKVDGYSLNLIINYNFYKENEKYLNELIKNDYNILFYNFNKENLRFINNNQKHNYCFSSIRDEEFKNQCMNNNLYTILKEDIISKNYLQNVKKKLTNGCILVLKGSYENELSSIINYISSKGYDVLNLDDLLDENIKK